ncbi:Cobalt-zinc-cadmium resistance protein CzcA; Cation efflux system protein CusA [Klebsiella pneumoniae IS39]|nr:Cobalt-zinc-cadmium resistance protein CzcA; Cation efflux system protein CusA [Klebsiella pneumoniae IS39]
MGVSFIHGVNVIDVGHALEARLQQMAADKPAGIDIAIFYDQAAEVAHSVNGFITNFLMALAIVVGVLLVFMGVRSGIIIALSLALNVLGTLLIMYIWGIELQRISLGALIIALSMLVDNAIVIVEGVLIARQQGSPLLGAINYVIRRSALPLLGATIIAILAFAPIGLSQDSTGEYCKSLFQVLLISLMLSWFSALTITPVLIKWWLFKKRPVGRRRGGKSRSLPRQLLPWLSADAANTAAAKDPDPGADGRAVSRSDLGLYLCSAEFFSVIEYAYILCRPVATLRYRYKRHGEDDPGYRAVDSRSAGGGHHRLHHRPGQYAFHSHLQRAAPVQQLRADYGADG